MLHRNVHVAVTGLALADQLPLNTALANNWITHARAAVTDQVAVRAERRRTSGSRLAADAALTAINSCYLRDRRGEIGPVYHAAMSAGDEFAAARVMTRLHLPNAHRHPAVTFANGDQGIVDALSAAALYLDQQRHLSGATHAIISAGQTWPGATFERWNHPVPLGDGGGALVLSSEGGPLQLVATATRVDVVLEELRGDRAAPTAISERLHTVLTEVVATVLDEAGIDPGDIGFLVTPFGARPEHAVGRALGKINEEELERQITQGRHLGRMGATDLIASLNELMNDTTPARPGDHVLMLVDSAGPSVGAAVFEVH